MTAHTQSIAITVGVPVEFADGDATSEVRLSPTGKRIGTMSSAERIKLEDIIEDVKSMMTDFELMEKYELTPKGLRHVLEKLMSIKAVSVKDLYRRPVFYEEQPEHDDRRNLHRHYLALLLPIYDVKFPETRGWLTDVTDHGVGTRGLEATPDDAITLAIIPEKFSDSPLIVFDAVCQWTEGEGPDAEPMAGFEIADISESNLRALRQLVRFVTIDN